LAGSGFKRKNARPARECWLIKSAVCVSSAGEESKAVEYLLYTSRIVKILRKD
jgi:hypothetical protein